MSEYTNYFAVPKETGAALKEKVMHLGVHAAIHDIDFNKDGHVLLVESEDAHWTPIDIGSDYTNPAQVDFLSPEFDKVLELWIDEARSGWKLACYLKGDKRKFTFDYQDEGTTEISEGDKEYLASIFDKSFDIFGQYLKEGEENVWEFCQVVGLPCNFMVDQSWISTGTWKEEEDVIVDSEQEYKD